MRNPTITAEVKVAAANEKYFLDAVAALDNRGGMTIMATQLSPAGFLRRARYVVALTASVAQTEIVDVLMRDLGVEVVA